MADKDKSASALSKFGNTCKDAMMSGISYMIPVVIGGALIMAIGNLMSGANPVEGTLAFVLYTWGNALFGCLNYILAMYTAYKIGSRPALAPGLLVGLFAADAGGGFLGAVCGGILAGFLVKWLNAHIKLPGDFASAKGLVILPFLSCLVMLFAMNYVFVPIFSALSNGLTEILTQAQSLSPFIFGGICAALVAMGMGSFPGWAVFAVATIVLESTGSFQIFTAMTAGGACCNLGIAIATLVAPKKFTPDERTGIVSLLTGWLCCITEMEIPYALRDPKSVFPAVGIGGFVGGGLVFVLGVEVPAMHGGMIVAPLANNLPLWAVCVAATALTTCLVLLILKRNLPPEESGIGVKEASNEEA